MFYEYQKLSSSLVDSYPFLEKYNLSFLNDFFLLVFFDGVEGRLGSKVSLLAMGSEAIGLRQSLYIKSKGKTA